MNPRLYDGDTKVQYISEGDLLWNLKKTALGLSSSLHEWDQASEIFVDTAIQNGIKRVLIVTGKDEAISSK